VGKSGGKKGQKVKGNIPKGIAPQSHILLSKNKRGKLEGKKKSQKSRKKFPESSAFLIGEKEIRDAHWEFARN
jgi:hypothetical protein